MTARSQAFNLAAQGSERAMLIMIVESLALHLRCTVNLLPREIQQTSAELATSAMAYITQLAEEPMNEHFGARFRLEINSLEEFASFVAIIRGSDLDDPKLLEMTARLRKSTKALSDAERADDAGRKTP